MNIIAKVVKETVLLPYRVAQGAAAALDEVVNGEKKEPKK